MYVPLGQDLAYQRYVYQEKTLKEMEQTKWYQFIKRRSLRLELAKQRCTWLLEGIGLALIDLEKSGMIKISKD